MTDNKINPVDAIKHSDDHRVSIPTTELAGEEVTAVAELPKKGAYQTFRHDFDRGRDPELYWLGKYRGDSEEMQSADLSVDTRSLYVHEDVQPEMLINQLYTLRSGDSQQPMLFPLNDIPNAFDDEIGRMTEYYHHSADWKNRLIQGDSLLVMNSLLQREGMAGTVQCIYIDPPYGIKYGSNWQMKLNSREVKDNDESVSGEPEMIKAFRDTWELGIHSYLTYLRDRLVLARELLTQSGSCFVQISDENVHLVRCLMDEVFGSENFVSQIIYTKTSGFTANTISNVFDYIVWYAKDKEQVKFRRLYIPKSYKEDGKLYSRLELSDGSRYTIAEWEKKVGHSFDFYNRPQESRCYMHDNLTSSGSASEKQPFVFNGNTFYPANGNHWKAKYPNGMKRLADKGRIAQATNSLQYVRFFDDFPYKEETNIWSDSTFGSFGEEKLYVVRTSVKIIQRCILMTTDPGDLVLDPTCGSGTTAYVAEQWGRRWITIDTSRIALNIAKRRLMTAVYPYYELFDKKDGNVRQGFVYKRVPHVTLKSLANDEPAEEETLYDQPVIDKRKLRVSGPFTVETLQAYNVTPPSDIDHSPNESEENRLFQERVFAHLQANGIRNGDRTQQAIFHGVEATTSPYLHARGYYTDADGAERLAYFHIGPKFGPVSKQAVNKAIGEFRGRLKEGASWLVLLGFSFEDNINESDYNFGNFTVSKVRMHDDLMQDGLLKKDRKAGSFITIGEPDIALVNDDEEHCHVEIRGLDIYDPIKDDVKARSVEDIAYWEIDDDYNGTQFIVRGIYFCGGDKREFAAWRKGLTNVAPKSSARTKKSAEQTLRLEFKEEQWERLYGFKSAPIDRVRGRKIAVRVVSQYGEESSRVIDVE